MQINFKVPFKAWLNGPSAESLNLRTSFEEKAYLVHVNIEGNDPLQLEKSSPETKFFRSTTFLNFEVTLKYETLDNVDDFKLLISEKVHRVKLFRLLVTITNRLFRSIRNFGTVAHLQEIRPQDNELEPLFRKWDVKYTLDGTAFQSYYTPINALGLLARSELYSRQLYSSSDYDTPSIDISDWPDIEEAIQDKLKPRPEEEFFTNAIEFLRTRNYRMALLESVICLEIVLTQYLKAFFSIRKEISKTRIEEFLSPQLGLSCRLSGLLELTLEDKDLKNINIDKILLAVRWRNHIIHKSGNLPDQLQEGSLRDGISNVLGLSRILAQRRDQILAEPELQMIAKKVAEDNKVPLPTIWVIRKHNIWVDVQFIFEEIPKNHGVLKKVASDLSRELKSRDHRFDEDKHLYVRFIKFPNITIARWHHGALEIIEKIKA